MSLTSLLKQPIMELMAHTDLISLTITVLMDLISLTTTVLMDLISLIITVLMDLISLIIMGHMVLISLIIMKLMALRVLKNQQTQLNPVLETLREVLQAHWEEVI